MSFALTVIVWFFIIGWASFMLAMLVGFLFSVTDDRRHQYYAEEGAWDDCDCWGCTKNREAEYEDDDHWVCEVEPDDPRTWNERRMSREDWAEMAEYVADLKSEQAREYKHWED